jgi:hypothetical protein
MSMSMSMSMRMRMNRKHDHGHRDEQTNRRSGRVWSWSGPGHGHGQREHHCTDRTSFGSEDEIEHLRYSGRACNCKKTVQTRASRRAQEGGENRDERARRQAASGRAGGMEGW